MQITRVWRKDTERRSGKFRRCIANNSGQKKKSQKSAGVICQDLFPRPKGRNLWEGVRLSLRLLRLSRAKKQKKYRRVIVRNHESLLEIRALRSDQKQDQIRPTSSESSRKYISQTPTILE